MSINSKTRSAATPARFNLLNTLDSLRTGSRTPTRSAYISDRSAISMGPDANGISQIEVVSRSTR